MSISVVGYLVNIQLLFYLVVKIPSAVMMPYIVQVRPNVQDRLVPRLIKLASRLQSADTEKWTEPGESTVVGLELSRSVLPRKSSSEIIAQCGPELTTTAIHTHGALACRSQQGET